MPLVRRLPKFGFTSRNRIEYAVVNVSTIQKLVDTKKITDGVVNAEVLVKVGAVSNKREPMKVLGDGELTAKVTVTAHKFSKSAVEKIQKAGGTATEIVAPEKAAS